MLSDLIEKRTPLKTHKFMIWADLEDAADIGSIVNTLIDSIRWMDHVGGVKGNHVNKDGWHDNFREER
jgi:hypothetical protein